MDRLNELKLISSLLCETVTGKCVQIPDDVIKNADDDITYRIICTQGISLTFYPVLKKHNGDIFRILEERLRSRYYTDLYHTLQQQQEGKVILASLGSAGLDHIALKGWVMKRLYRSPEQRNMADIDILVRDYDYKRVKEALEGCGYSSDDESSWMHDTFRKGNITIEMHKRLSDDSGVLRAWETRMWHHARLKRGTSHEYVMAWEDYFIFHMVHMYKDFKDGHLGLRRLLDMWILLERSDKQLNFRYVNSVLKKAGMLSFVKKMQHLAYSLFDEGAYDKNDLILIEFMIESGIYGTDKTYKLGRIVRNSSRSTTLGKIGSFVSAIFLPVDRMKAHFPILEKYPLLLPFMWVKRILHFAKSAGQCISKLDYSNISDADHAKMKRVFEAGGLL